jgi:hypothetical protein
MVLRNTTVCGADVRVYGSLEPSVAHLLGQAVFDIGLDDGRLPRLQHVDFRGVDIDAPDLMPFMGQAYRTDQAHIA